MRWVDKFIKEKEILFKKEHSQITLKQLYYFLIKFLKKEGVYGIYRKSFLLHRPHYAFSNKNEIISFFESVKGYSNVYLNDKTIYNLFFLSVEDYFIRIHQSLTPNDITPNDSLSTIISKHKKNTFNHFINDFFEFLKTYGFYRYIKII